MIEIVMSLKENQKDLKGFLKKILYGEIEFDWDEYFELYEGIFGENITYDFFGEDTTYSGTFIRINDLNVMEISIDSLGVFLLVSEKEEIIKNLKILLNSFEKLTSKFTENKQIIEDFFEK